MNAPAPKREPRRNKGFDETHREMIETAVRLISEKGADAISIAAIAREMGINRTTVYYHFDSREALIAAVKAWASEQLARGMDEAEPMPDRMVGICRFVLENPELIKLWIDDFLVGSDIRDSYAMWEPLVQGVQQHFDRSRPDEKVDAEIYCAIMLTSAFIAPRVFANSVAPGQSTDRIVERFLKEQARVMKRDGLM